MLQDTTAHRLHWDQKYAQGNTHADYRPDIDLVELIHHVPSTGLALDVACGTGRNSFFIAEHGLDVVCADFSAEGLKFLLHHGENKTVSKKIFPVQADLTKMVWPENAFDAIFVIRYLDRQAFDSYINALKTNGLLLFKAFNLNHLKQKPQFNKEYLLSPGELLKAFKDSRILASNDCAGTVDEESMILVQKT